MQLTFYKLRSLTSCLPFHEAHEEYQGNSTLSTVIQKPQQHTNIPLPCKTPVPKHHEPFPPLQYPSPVKRKLERKHLQDHFPSHQVKQFLISPSVRTPEVRSTLDRPSSSLDTTQNCKSIFQCLYWYPASIHPFNVVILSSSSSCILSNLTISLTSGFFILSLLVVPSMLLKIFISVPYLLETFFVIIPLTITPTSTFSRTLYRYSSHT